jgi:hypothetical protein
MPSRQLRTADRLIPVALLTAEMLWPARTGRQRGCAHLGVVHAISVAFATDDSWRSGAPGAIRTHTERDLNPLPLPLGYGG